MMHCLEVTLLIKGRRYFEADTIDQALEQWSEQTDPQDITGIEIIQIEEEHVTNQYTLKPNS